MNTEIKMQKAWSKGLIPEWNAERSLRTLFIKKGGTNPLIRRRLHLQSMRILPDQKLKISGRKSECKADRKGIEAGS
jgi:hypothetical protein